ncbi:MAG: ROK family protein [Solirubrobacteraceae bacterium]
MSSVIGVDLGGTKIALAGLRGRHLGESVIKPTDRSSAATLIDQIAAIVDDQRAPDLQAVGIGVPSVVEFATGRVISSVNVPLADVPLRKLLGERLAVPVFVENDATVAAFAEAHDADLRLVAENLVMLTIGTGVGGGLVLGGRIYRGATGGAGELGHTIVGLGAGDLVPPAAGFPQTGSLESLASGHALDRLAERGAEDPGSSLGRLRVEGRAVLGADAVQAAHDGDATAVRIVEVWAERVGIGVANAINTFDPEEVVIGGGAARAGELLLAAVRRVARDYVLPGLGTGTTIRLARHGVRAGVLGAALLAVHELQTVNAHAPIDDEAPTSPGDTGEDTHPSTEVH